MCRWGTRTYVNCYVTHIIGVSLGHSANCAYGCYILVQLYMHLYSRTFTFALQQPIRIETQKNKWILIFYFVKLLAHLDSDWLK